VRGEQKLLVASHRAGTSDTSSSCNSVEVQPFLSNFDEVFFQQDWVYIERWRDRH